MAEQPHLRFYGRLPPVRPRRLRWLVAGAVVAIGVTAVVITEAVTATPTGRGVGDGGGWVFAFPPFDWYPSLAWLGGSFIIGGVLGALLARGRWRMFAVDALGLAIALALLLLAFSHTYMAFYAWWLWVFGVSAGVGVRGLIERHRIQTTSVIRPGGSRSPY